MPTAVHLDGGTTGASPTGITTNSATPTANSLQLLLLAITRGSSTQPTAPSSVTGCGLTWVQVGTAIDYDTVGTLKASLFLYRALGTPTAGALTVTFGYTADRAAYEWDEWSGVDTSGTNGSGAVVQAVQADSGANDNHPTVTLAAFGSSRNGTYGGSGAQSLAAVTPQGTGFTELNHQEVTGTATVGTISEWRSDNDTSVDTNLASSATWGIFGLEIKGETNPSLAGKGTAAAAATDTLKLSAALAGKGTAAARATGALLVNGAATKALAGKGTAASAGSARLGVNYKMGGKGTAASGGRAWITLPTDLPVAGVLYGNTFTVPDLSNAIDVLTFADASWQEQVSDSGAGQLTIQNDMTQPALGQLIGMYIEGRLVWTMICEHKLRKTVQQGEEAVEVTVWSGPGHLALFKRALTYPVLGLDAQPKQRDMVYDWTHPDYDDSWWAPAQVVATSATAAVSWTGALWAIDDGSTSIPEPATSILAAPNDSITDAELGNRFLRKTVTITESRDEYFLFFGGDDTFAMWIDGCPILNSDTNQNFTNRNMVQLDLSIGEHTFAWQCTNLLRASPGENPTGSAWDLYAPGFPLTLIAYPGDGASPEVVVGPTELLPDPDDPPGMSPGHALRLWLEAAQARGCLTYITLAFDDDNDSDGVPWTTDLPSGRPSARISTKILTDGLTFLREVSATYCDFRMSPDGFVLYAWNKGTMNYVSSGQTWTPLNNVTVLEQQKEFAIANVLVGEYNDSYLADEDTTSVALYERIEGRLAIGAANGADEAQRVLDQALVLYANPREEISVQVDGPTGYLDYDLGQLADTLDSEGSAITERIVAITVSTEKLVGRVLTTPTLKDLLLDAPSGLTQATNKMIPGT